MTKKNALATFEIPFFEEITPINKIAGKLPPYTSLKYHDDKSEDDWTGKGMIALAAEIKQGTIPDKDTGEVGDYILANVCIYDIGTEPRKTGRVFTINTSAGGVFGRMQRAIQENLLPARGKLRRSGRAWFWIGEDE